MTKEEFDTITSEIGCWFTHLKLNSFRKTFDGEIYPSSALGTDYDLFIHELEKELSFEDKPSLPSNLDEAAEQQANLIYPENIRMGHVAEHDVNLLTRRGFIKGFKAGAEWMAEQAVDWLAENIRDYVSWDGEIDTNITFDFQRALETLIQNKKQ